MGSLTEALHLAPKTSDLIMKIILCYLLVGSYASLLWLWKEKQETRITSPSSVEATNSVL
jgi:hypothetical protein